MNKDEIMRNKMLFHGMFRDGGKMELDNGVFSDSALIKMIQAKFGRYAKNGIVERISIDKHIVDELIDYKENTFIVFYADGLFGNVQFKQPNIGIGIGAVTISAFINSSKLTRDYIGRNLNPLYRRLTAVDGFISSGRTHNLDCFVSVYVAEHILGYKSDISEAVYAHFLEAEKLVA